MGREMDDEVTSVDSARAALVWSDLAKLTPARVALGRRGAGLPTSALLDFALDHARARDAVHAPFHPDSLAARLRSLGLIVAIAASGAENRSVYLRRPDLGRRLSARSAAALADLDPSPCDLALVIADGLSATAVDAHALEVVTALLPRLAAAGVTLGPIVLVEQGRVAIGDEIGALLRAPTVAVLLGERPGLSAPDSLGIYLTHDPRPGRNDSERNCISNIRAAGLPPAEAAYKLMWLLAEALRRQTSGIALKDESGAGGTKQIAGAS
jgi:ethanolamine ammonia-lyase small subunit